MLTFVICRRAYLKCSCGIWHRSTICLIPSTSSPGPKSDEVVEDNSPRPPFCVRRTLISSKHANLPLFSERWHQSCIILIKLVMALFSIPQAPFASGPPPSQRHPHTLSCLVVCGCVWRRNGPALFCALRHGWHQWSGPTDRPAAKMWAHQGKRGQSSVCQSQVRNNVHVSPGSLTNTDLTRRSYNLADPNDRQLPETNKWSSVSGACCECVPPLIAVRVCFHLSVL